MEVKTESKEASMPNTGREAPAEHGAHDTYKAPLDAASTYEESEVEGTFTVKDGKVIDETEKPRDAGWEYKSGDKDAEIVATTPEGKKIQIVKDPVHAGYTIEFASGGQLPAQLQGKWTSYDRAKEAVRVYLGHKAEG